MNKRFKSILMFMIFGFLFLTTGCSTSSFCTTKDKVNIRNAYAEKITIAVVNYYENEYSKEDSFDNVTQLHNQPPTNSRCCNVSSEKAV